MAPAPSHPELFRAFLQPSLGWPGPGGRQSGRLQGWRLGQALDFLGKPQRGLRVQRSRSRVGAARRGLERQGGSRVGGRVRSLARRTGRAGQKRGVPRLGRGYAQPLGLAGRKGASPLTLEVEPRGSSSRKPFGSALARLWGLMPSASLSPSQRVQWPVSRVAHPPRVPGLL